MRLPLPFLILSLPALFLPDYAHAQAITLVPGKTLRIQFTVSAPAAGWGSNSPNALLIRPAANSSSAPVGVTAKLYHGTDLSGSVAALLPHFHFRFRGDDAPAWTNAATVNMRPFLDPALPQSSVVDITVEAGTVVIPNAAIGRVDLIRLAGPNSPQVVHTSAVQGVTYQLLDTYTPPAVPPPQILSCSSSAALFAEPYSGTVQTRYGLGTLNFWRQSGALPPGLTLAGNILSGTPTQPGVFTFTLAVSDGRNPALSHTKTCSITVETNSSTPPAPAIRGCPADISGIVGNTVSYPFEIADGRAPFTISVTGALPPGLSLPPYTPERAFSLAGALSVVGNYSYRLEVIDSRGLRSAPRNCSLQVTSPPANPTPPTFGCTRSQAQIGVRYLENFVLTGQAPVRLRLLSGSLPPGIRLGSNGANYFLDGIPGVPGNYWFTLEAEDGLQPPLKSTETCLISVPAIPAATPSVNCPHYAAAQPGVPMLHNFILIGNAPLSLALESGSIPAGLLFANYALSGTPTTAGTYQFTLRVTDGNGVIGKKACAMFVGVPVPPPPAITACPVPTQIRVGLPYHFPVPVTGTEPISVSMHPYVRVYSDGDGGASAIPSRLPAGLTITNNAISGTPTGSGDGLPLEFRLIADDATGRSSERICALQSVPQAAITACPVSSVTAGSAVTQYVQVYGWSPVQVSVVSGTLPPGLSLSGINTISGTAGAPGGPYTFTLRVTDGGNPAETAERTCSMTITPPPPPAIAACPASSVTYGTPVSLPLPVTGYAPVRVSLLSGSLPPGLTLANNTISGTPFTAGGPYTFTLLATDGSTPAQTSQRSCAISVPLPPPPAITACPASSYPTGMPINWPVPVTGQPPVSVSLSSGSLPPGLILANNTISGTPGAVGGPYSFTLLARDGVTPAQTVERSCSVSIAPVPPVVLSSSVSSITPAQLKSYCEQPSGIVQINGPLKVSSGSATITMGCTLELMTGPVLLEIADVALTFNGALSIIGRSTSSLALSKTRLTANSAGIDLRGANSAILATEASIIASTGALSISVGHQSTIEWLKRHSSQSNSLSSAAVLSLTAGDKFSGSFTEARLLGAQGVNISLPGTESLFKAGSTSTIEAPSGSISLHASGSKAVIEVGELTARFGQSLSITALGTEGTLKLSKLAVPGPASGAVTLHAGGLVEATEVTLNNAASANVGSTNGYVKFFKGNVSVNGDIVFEGKAGTEVNENTLHSPTRVRIASPSGSCVASSNSITAPVVQSCP